MKTFKPKILLIALFVIAILFFSNDLGLLDIEKTAIITAIAIDKEEQDYVVACQIAVPEASNAVSENKKALRSGKGSTVANAIKNMGSVSGWFPQTIFCNLIIVGNSLLEQDVISVLDYFSKTMRVQDSAQVILSENNAKDLLNATTPLDNISSFAIQKILLKNPGFDQDVRPVDIKTFCVDYYSYSQSSYMPIVKVLSSESSKKENAGEVQGSQDSAQKQDQGNQSGNKTEDGKYAFDATTTALFLKGKKVGELDKPLTNTFNLLTKNINGTGFGMENVDGVNYLLTVINGCGNIKVKADQNGVTLYTKVKLYCKISDQTDGNPDNKVDTHKPLPTNLIMATENMFENNIRELIEVSKNTGCDFLHIKEKLYRFCYPYYHRYKDNYLNNLKLDLQVEVSGQK